MCAESTGCHGCPTPQVSYFTAKNSADDDQSVVPGSIFSTYPPISRLQAEGEKSSENMTADQLDSVWRSAADDLWIKRRLEMASLLEAADALKVEGSAELRDFLQFLASECAGAEFTSDRQWGELLNLMQINRKLNHRTVKLVDLMHNRQAIEANRLKIRKLNRAAKLVKTIEESLTQLEATVEACKLHLPTLSESSSVVSLASNLSEARGVLQDKCWPIWRTVKSSLANQLVTERTATSQLDSWADRCRRQEIILSSLSEFLERFESLERNLAQLAPLVMAGQSGEKTSLQDSSVISSCKQTFNSLLAKRNKLLVSLEQLIPRSRPNSKGSDRRSVNLNKLLSSRGKIENELYSNELLENQKSLEECKEQLEEVLRNLRLEFGRFYFVSDLELLTIVALDSKLVLASDETKHAPLISKLFSNSISRFVLKEDKFVVGVESPIGEILLFDQEDYIPVKKRINIYSAEVVRILNEVGRKVSRCLSHKLARAFARGDMDWRLPVQLITLTAYINFTLKVEKALEVSGLDAFDHLIADYESALEDIHRNKPTEGRLIRFKYSTLASRIVHFISISRKLKASGVRCVNDWNWQRQPRYYLSGDELEVRIAGSRFEYKFDFLPVQAEGKTSSVEDLEEQRLVSTRITESCMLVASYAVGQLGLGANPFGPAGSGKTETIKALGHLLGRQVIVHNCDDSNDADSLARLVLGLAHTGLWGCFDEFNRLSASVLSSVSGLLERVQTGIRLRKATVEMPGGNLVCVDETSAFFITLNPSDDPKYRGRRRLPANLRSLLLPVAMTDVQIREIVRENLMALGNIRLMSVEADEISLKFSELLDKMKNEFGHQSKGQICTWDLRLAVAIMRRFELLSHDNQFSTLDHTRKFGLSILREVEPRLEESQAQVLRKIVADHFSIDQAPRGADEEKLCSKLRLVANERFKINGDKLNKVINRALGLFQQLETRTGVALLGGRNSGKSFSWRLLSEALGETIAWFALNPKSYTKDQLFGHFDSATQKWIDGVLSNRVRDAHNLLFENRALKQVWLLLDGPVDPDWVEQLNSVLDENRTLTLSSGERLSFCPTPGKTIKLLLETRNLDYASPATISRLGLVQHEARASGDVILRLNTAEELKKQIKSLKNKLTILETDRPDLLELNEDSSVFEYTCSKVSNASHLSQLISLHKSKRLIVIHGLNWVEPDDKWGSISFIQLLKFVSTYGTYYQSNESVSIKSDFLVTIDSLANSLSWAPFEASLISLSPIGSNSSRILELDALGAMIEINNLPTITTLTLIKSSSAIHNGILNLLKNQYIVHELRSCAEVQSAVTRIEQILNSVSPPVEGEKLVYIVTSRQLNMISGTMRSRLLHALNEFRGNCCDSKFIHLNYPKETLSDEWNFWSSVGSHYQFESQENHKSLISSSIAEYGGRSGPKLKGWVESKLDQLYCDLFADEGDLSLFEAFLVFLFDTLNTFQSNIEASSRDLTLGLGRLEMFECSIQKLNIKLAQNQKQMEEKRSRLELKDQDVNRMLTSLQANQKKLAESKERHAIQEREVKQRSQDVELELVSVAKLVGESSDNVNKTLKPEALNEIKSLRAPPKTIKDILDVLFVLLGVKDSSWTAMKGFLARVSLREELAKFDFRTRLSGDILRRVESEIKSKRDSFDLKRATKASSAVVPLVQWIEAALAYGRVLVKLEPLRVELQKLAANVRELEETSEKLEFETKDLDVQVASAMVEQDKMRIELKSIEGLVTAGEREIVAAKKALRSVSNQMKRWSEQLTRLKKETEDDDLVRLSLFIAHRVMCEDSSLTPKYFDLSPTSENDLISHIVSLIRGLEAVEVPEDVSCKSFLAKLTFARLLVESKNCPRVPFLELGNSSRHKKSADLVKLLGDREILAPEAEIEVVDCGRGVDGWKESIDIGAKLGKLVVVRLEDSTNNLDIANLIASRGSSGLQLMLLGQRNRHVHLNDSIVVIEIQDELESLNDIQNALISRFIRSLDPELSELIEHLELQLHEARGKLRGLERNLIESLAKTHTSAGSEIDHELLAILENLSMESERLESDIKLLNSERTSLDAKRDLYAGAALEAASFYIEYIAKLAEKSRFYRIDLDSYVGLLLSGCATATTPTTTPTRTASSEIRINLGRVIQSALSSMRPQDRLHFEGKLARRAGEVMQPVSCVDLEQTTRNVLLACSNQLQVAPALLENLSHGLASNRLSLDGGGRVQLMLVVHEPTSSSPMIVLDDLFSRLQDEASARGGGESKSGGRVDYCKVYASSDTVEHLDRELGRVLKIRQADGRESFGCVCVVNAHLAADWLNTKLPALIEHKSTSPGALIILVAESTAVDSGEDGDSYVFSSNLTDIALVKFWHDDLALELTRRFDLLASSLPVDCRKYRSLQRQLVLLHVVCQELVRLACNGSTGGSSMDRWSRAYAFDLDQLRLATRLLEQMDPELIESLASQMLIRKLEALVYGARLESEHDLRLFAKLANRFLCPSHVAESIWRQFEELRKVVAEERVELLRQKSKGSGYLQAICSLIGCEGQPLAVRAESDGTSQ